MEWMMGVRDETMANYHVRLPICHSFEGGVEEAIRFTVALPQKRFNTPRK